MFLVTWTSAGNAGLSRAHASDSFLTVSSSSAELPVSKPTNNGKAMRSGSETLCVLDTRTAAGFSGLRRGVKGGSSSSSDSSLASGGAFADMEVVIVVMRMEEGRVGLNGVDIRIGSQSESDSESESISSAISTEGTSETRALGVEDDGDLLRGWDGVVDMMLSSDEGR
ncbi:hypothetical protein CPB85DRAFT_687081 [Mucidula mucida]|nr:hypothetical protein CPB85DRAFT_687081 [Mucidula mucida]